jgi:LysM repeat protein
MIPCTVLVPPRVRQNLATFTEVWQPSGLVVGRHLFAGFLAISLLSWADLAEARSDGRQIHVVYPGQRLGSIAKRYNVSVEVICQVNGIERPDLIKPGQRLEIPSRAEARKLAEQAKAGTAKPTDVAKPADNATKASDTAQAAKATSKTAVVAAAKTDNKAETSKAVKETKSSAKAEVALAKTQTPAAGKSAPVAPAKAEDVKASTLKSGTTRLDPVTMLPTGLAHRVKAGDSLSGIAVRYDTTVKELLQANNLRRDQVIRIGQVLTIPQAPVGSGWWAKFAKKPPRAGEIEVFAHHAYSVRWKGKVVDKGKVQPAARAALSRMLGATGSAPPVPDRLIQLLVHVSDTFGGRPIRLVSGYRTTSYVKDSRHRHSSAVDFSIPGVPNAALRDYLLQLGNVGVGFYPNSSFVHLDVRGKSAYWVDYAGPGEAPRKAPRGDERVAEVTTTSTTAKSAATKSAATKSAATKNDGGSATAMAARSTAATTPSVKELDVLGERTIAAIEGNTTPSAGLAKRPPTTPVTGALGARGTHPVDSAQRGVAVSKSIAAAESELLKSVPSSAAE